MRPVLVRLAALLSLVTVASAQITLNPTPSRAIGQTSLKLDNFSPNLAEGRELFSPQGIALDLTTNPPGLYIADTGNNRVLGFRSALGFANGRKADIVIGQADLTSTTAQGPNRGSAPRVTGLASPTSLTVDTKGNLYVVDAANNRILRFPKPFTQAGDQLPDFVIGQRGFTTNGTNQDGVSAATLALSVPATGGNVSTSFSSLAFDPSGNLWVTDPFNNRVLRYNVKDLGPDSPPGPAAEIVLGQSDFTTSTYTPRGAATTSLNAIGLPAGLVVDSAGRLYVAEALSAQRGRILFWNAPLFTGQAATRLLGVVTDSNPPTVSDLQLNASPAGLFLVGSQLGIADTFNNRLLLYRPATQWTADTQNQQAAEVVGQKDFFTGTINQGLPSPGPDTLARPVAAAYANNELYVVDVLNHRVVVLPSATSGFGPAVRIIGQDLADQGAPNLIEGREFNFTQGGDAGLAVDLASNPPRLYVADTYNHRILGFKDLRNIPFGAKADIVIGQPDFQHNLINYPANDGNRPNQSGLSSPTGLYVDPDGNLFVADSANGRVLRFPKPFENYVPGVLPKADLLLGQLNYFTRIPDASARTMASPYGLAQASEQGLLVSDAGNNRVLFFRGTSKTFTSGQSATIVFGQKDFNSSAPGSGPNQLSAPRHIATDSDDRLYVADAGNGRVLIFDHAPSSIPDASAAVTLTNGLNSPRGMYVSIATGDIWVADAGTNVAIRFPGFNALAANGFAANAAIQSVSPRAVTQDQWGNVFIADAANRVAIHVPGLASLNAANYLFSNAAAPGMIGALYSRGNQRQFGEQTEASTKIPLSRALAGLQLLFDKQPVPLFSVSPDQINFQVPYRAATSGTANLQVVEVATGRILGETTLVLAPALPGVFTQAANGSGAAVAQNQDGTLNTEKNPAVAGSVITLYGTGQGVIDNPPADGEAATGPLSSPRPPTVFIGTEFVTGGDVLYSGLAPSLVGVWQVNVRIPKNQITLPDNPTQLLIIQNSVASGGAGQGRRVIIYVKQP